MKLGESGLMSHTFTALAGEIVLRKNVTVTKYLFMVWSLEVVCVCLLHVVKCDLRIVKIYYFPTTMKWRLTTKMRMIVAMMTMSVWVSRNIVT